MNEEEEDEFGDRDESPEQPNFEQEPFVQEDPAADVAREEPAENVFRQTIEPEEEHKLANALSG